jgi:hypothetical protein
MNYMDVALIAVAVAVVLLLVLGLRRVMATGFRARAIFSDEHIIEYLGGLDRVRTAACDPALIEYESSGEVGPVRGGDPRTAETSVQLRLVYTVAVAESEPDTFTHYISLSHRRGLRTVSEGRMLAGLTLTRLNVPPQSAKVFRTPSLVVHVRFKATESGHAAIASQDLALPTREDLPSIRQQANQLGHSIDFDLVET